MATERTTICRGIRPTLALACGALTVVVTLAAQPSPPATKPPDNIIALDPRWTVSFETAPSAPAGYDQQIAYVPLKNGTLIAIDLARGAVLWQVALETAATPATGDGLVFVAGDRLIIALDQRTGRTEWRAPLDDQIAAPLHWDGGWLFVSMAAGQFAALQSQDGAVAWRTPLGSPLASAPSSAGDRVYTATRDGRVTALVLSTGAIEWSREVKQDVTGMLALDDQLLVGTRADLLHSLSLDSGRIRWSQKAGADIAGRPAADERRIYFAAFDNLLRALDRRTGNLQWLHGFPSRPAGGPLRVDNVVLVPLITTDIGAFDAATGKPAFTIRAIGELGGVPFLRESATPTQPRLVAMSREGTLQGFAARYEPPPAPLASLPGVPVKGAH